MYIAEIFLYFLLNSIARTFLNIFYVFMIVFSDSSYTCRNRIDYAHSRPDGHSAGRVECAHHLLVRRQPTAYVVGLVEVLAEWPAREGRLSRRQLLLRAKATRTAKGAGGQRLLAPPVRPVVGKFVLFIVPLKISKITFRKFGCTTWRAAIAQIR